MATLSIPDYQLARLLQTAFDVTLSQWPGLRAELDREFAADERGFFPFRLTWQAGDGSGETIEFDGTIRVNDGVFEIDCSLLDGALYTEGWPGEIDMEGMACHIFSALALVLRPRWTGDQFLALPGARRELAEGERVTASRGMWYDATRGASIPVSPVINRRNPGELAMDPATPFVIVPLADGGEFTHRLVNIGRMGKVIHRHHFLRIENA